MILDIAAYLLVATHDADYDGRCFEFEAHFALDPSLEPLVDGTPVA